MCTVGLSKNPEDFISTWFPKGPSFDFFPFPMIDNRRPWGRSDCKDCKGECQGHYITDMDRLLQLHSSAKIVRAMPPSAVIEEAYSKTPNLTNFEDLARKCCLSQDDVQMWWDHLRQIAINRAKGVEKAKALNLRSSFYILYSKQVYL